MRLAYFASAALCALLGCSSSGNNGTTSGGSCPDNLVDAKGSEFCADDAVAVDCTRVSPAITNQVCGVPLITPPAPLARSSNVKEYAGTGAPQLGCFDKADPSYPKQPGASKKITVEGTAVIFSHGCQSNDLTIEISTVNRSGGADDGMPGDLVGPAVTTEGDCKATGVATDDDACGKRYECKFSYPGVPTETELIAKTSGGLWAPLYEYNIYVPNDELVGDKWTHDVRALALDDYGVISQAAIGRTISPGHGVVAGEVHDCGNVRLQNAIVDVDLDKVKTTYFTDNEDHPLPDLSADASSTLGLYASFDMAPGPVSVAAVGLVDGQVVTAGYFKARVFADSVTAVTHRGLRPFQLPPQ